MVKDANPSIYTLPFKLHTYSPHHLQPGCSLTAIDNIMDLKVKGDIVVGKPIVGLSRFSGEEPSMQEWKWFPLNIGW